MKALGIGLIATGLLICAYAMLAIDTVISDVQNLGLMHKQTLIFSTGALATLCGAIFTAAGFIADTSRVSNGWADTSGALQSAPRRREMLGPIGLVAIVLIIGGAAGVMMSLK